MSPMYNPDDWSQEFDIVLKYEPMSSSTVNNVLTKYKNQEVLEYIKELWNLIDYQRKIINQQTQEIVAIKHQQSWKRYDLPESKFSSIDKPPKSGNMSC